MKLIFESSPQVTIATNTFINVPVILKYEDTPMIEVVREQGIGFTTQIPIYHSDGTYLAKVRGNRIYLTSAGNEANLQVDDRLGVFVCRLDNQILFELRHGVGNAFKASAELYAPDGYFVKCTDSPKPELFDLSGNAIQVGESKLMGNVFQNLSVGIWLRKDGSYAIGVS